MKEFQTAYLPVGVPTFHLESAKKEFEDSAALLKQLCGNAAVPEDMLLSIDSLNGFMQTLDPDLIIFQNLTFANAAYIQEVLHQFPDIP